MSRLSFVVGIQIPNTCDEPPRMCEGLVETVTSATSVSPVPVMHKITNWHTLWGYDWANDKIETAILNYLQEYYSLGGAHGWNKLQSIAGGFFEIYEFDFDGGERLPNACESHEESGQCTKECAELVAGMIADANYEEPKLYSDYLGGVSTIDYSRTHEPMSMPWQEAEFDEVNRRVVIKEVHPEDCQCGKSTCTRED